MIGRLFSFLALKAIASDDPFVWIEYSQDASQGLWRCKFSLSGSTRDWAVSVRFAKGLKSKLRPKLPPDFSFHSGQYLTSLTLGRNKPVSLEIQSDQLLAVSGLVFVTFEAKGRIGGTIIPKWVPIGFADPSLLMRFDESVARLQAKQLTSHGG